MITFHFVRLSVAVLFLLLLFTVQGSAESHSENYVSGHVSSLLQGRASIEGENHDLEKGFGVSFAVGKKWSLFRLELEFAYQDMNQDAESFSDNALAGISLPSIVEGMRLSLEKRNDVVSAVLASDDWMDLDRKEVDAYDVRLMVNGWYDMEPASRFSLYVGGGLGLVNSHLSATYTTTATFDVERMSGDELVTTAEPSRYYSTIYSEREWGVGYQVGLGVSFAISERSKLGLSYRLNGVARDEPSVQAHNVFVGLQYLM